MSLDWRDRSTLGTLDDRHGPLVIRRFLTWHKAIVLLECGLRFSPACWFDDANEGHYPTSEFVKRDRLLRSCGFDDRALKTAHDANHAIAMHNRSVTLISCWTIGPTTSMRLWTDYASISEGLAIETTVGRVRAALGDEFLIAPVRYIDFDKAHVERDHSLRPFLYKSRAYEWEQEVRIIGNMEPGSRIVPGGASRDVLVDLNTFLQRLVVAPSATPEFVAMVHGRFRQNGCSLPIDTAGAVLR